MNFFPRRDQRVVVMGPTRSGKTFLIRTWLAYFKRVVIVDLKWKWIPVRKSIVVNRAKQINAGLFKEYDHVIYRPLFRTNIYASTANMQEMDQVPAQCLKIGGKTGGIILHYDDLVFVAGGSYILQRAPNYMLAVTTGGELGVYVWSAIQRNHNIPLISMTESDRRVTFYLRHASDRAVAEEVISEEIPWDELRKNKHSFFVAEDDSEFGPIILKAG